MILDIRYYVACYRGGDYPYRYYGNITTSHQKAESLLEEAKAQHPEEEWNIYYFSD